MTTKLLAAQILGRLGGLARAARLTAEERSAAMQKASAARRTRKGWPKGVPRRLTPRAPDD